jgi:hypothetical protein
LLLSFTNIAPSDANGVVARLKNVTDQVQIEQRTSPSDGSTHAPPPEKE